MTTTLTTDHTADLFDTLSAANRRFASTYPGDAVGRQPVHTLYGGANLFKAGLHRQLGAIALRNLDQYAPNAEAFAEALGLRPELAATVYERVARKLREEPIEELRIDFEDGYGNRPDTEEDGHAVQVAEQLAAAMAAGDLPPFIGVRIKPLTEESHRRSVRTLDLVLTGLARRTDGQIPDHFVVTLPKVTLPDQVSVLASLLGRLEDELGIEHGAVGIDLMIELPQVIIDGNGGSALRNLVRAGHGRVKNVAFGTYDYTAMCNITAAFQSHTHTASDFARHVMQVSLAGTGVALADGATTQIPIGPHRPAPDAPLTEEQAAENRALVHTAWRKHFHNISHSLQHGYYQGWDLNPAQLPIRYAAVYAFFLDGLADATNRLTRFIDQAAQATLVGNTFDDAATGQGLLNFFLRGLACGALTESEALTTGITIEELHGRSFLRIVENRASA